MNTRHLLEQIELLREHVQQGEPHPEFIERHALTIMDLARSLPVPTSLSRQQLLRVYTQLEEKSA